ncbi:MAG: BTAD domain-containing putative transcriptional regulator [Actinomycetota bacterium]
MQYQILGPLQVKRADEEIKIKGPKQRALLILLLLNANEVVSTDKLIEALWGDEINGREIGTLRVHIANLRSVLEPDRRTRDDPEILLTHPPGYMLKVDDDAIDCHRFERLISEGRKTVREDPKRAVELLEAGLELWGGTPLEDVYYEDFAQMAIHRLEELQLSATEDLNEARLAMGEHAELVVELESQVATHPLRERPWSQLMLALYRSGRQSEALSAHRRLSDILGQHGLVPGPGLNMLEDRILVNDPSLMTPTLRIGPRQSPPAERTRLIGRSHDLVELQSLFASTRLLTLTGSGGVGKTRLAQRFAWQVVEDGIEVWWVELSGLNDPRRIPDQIAAAGGVAQGPTVEMLDVLQRLIGSRKLVIVLDNCDHLIDETARIVDRLLSELTGVRFVVTSREPLQVKGELVWRVPSLPVPEPSAGANEIRRSPSVELFVERARERAGYPFTEFDLLDVAVICRRLDGIPLALELAAARTSALSPAEVSRRLADRFSVLERSDRTAITRHRTLEAAIDWSFQQLEDAERRLLSRLAVFMAGFDLPAARAVCAFDPLSEDDVESGLERLVDKSLIEPASRGREKRFRLTESIQAFAWDRLPDDPLEVLTRHRDWALALATTGSREILRDEGTWYPRLDAAHEDLRAAFDVSLRRGEVEEALRLVGLLGGYLLFRRTNEALNWLEHAIAAADQAPDGVSDATRALALLALGPFLCFHGRYLEGRQRLAEAGELFGELDHKPGLMWVHYQQSYFPAIGDTATALRDARSAVDLAGQIGKPEYLAYATARLAETTLSHVTRRPNWEPEQLEKVVSLADEAMRHCDELVDPYATTLATVAKGYVMALRGRTEEGWALVEEGVRRRHRFHLGLSCAYEDISAGHLAFRLGYQDRSSALLRSGLASLEKLGLIEVARPALVGAADTLQASAPEVAVEMLRAAEGLGPLKYHVASLFDEAQVVDRLRRELDIPTDGVRRDRLKADEAIALALAHI